MREFDPERWQRIETILDEVLDLEPSARAAFVAAACAGDADLLQDVEALLAAAAKTDPFIDSPLHVHAAPLLQGVHTRWSMPEEESLEGRIVGPYRVLREVGRGGMATVYLAERADGQFEQRVALKLIRRGLETSTVRRRFQQERQILADLQHPNIARLLDGGVSDEGQPYFAMEYVDGRLLATYCDERKLTLRERLQLFLGVCEAVHYAHQHLVVHRDLKPSNILVTPEGQVKLLDFGIAKVIVQDDGQGSATTRAGGSFLTPSYAAPEQLRHQPVTTATDVYALGMVLYELLTGHRPYSLEGLSPASAERLVAEQEPDRPSVVVAASKKEVRRAGGTLETVTPEGVAAARSTPRQRLRRQLAGDLDVIVLKALAKEPERRYGSAEALQRDLERYLGGRPVLARKGSVGYRTRKFVRRHRGGVTAGALLLLSLLVGTGGTVWQARAAALEGAKAAQVGDFLVDLFEISDPDQTQGENVTARELLDRAAQRVGTELEGQPAVQAEMLMLIAKVYNKLALYGAALPLVDRALALRRALHGAEHVDIAASLHARGELLNLTGADEQAEAALREALAMRRKLLGSKHPDVAATLGMLAWVRLIRNDVSEAERLGRQAVTMYSELLGAESEEAVEAMSRLAAVLAETEATAEAERLMRRILAINRERFGEEHSSVAAMLNNLSYVMVVRQDNEEAERLLRQALAIDRKLFGEEHRWTVEAKSSLAGVLHDLGQYEEAELLYREALELWRQRGEGERDHALITMNNLAYFFDDQGKTAEAAALFDTVVAISRKQLGPEHAQLALYLVNLSRLRFKLGDDSEAERLALEALGITRKALPPGHRITAGAVTRLAQIRLQQRRCNEVEPLLLEVIGSQPGESESLDPIFSRTTFYLGSCYLADGKYAEAEPLLLRSYAALLQSKSALTEHPEYRDEVLRQLVALYEAWPDSNKATEYRALLRS